MQRASALEATHPRRAAQHWARIDHDIVDAAPWLPLYNPVAIALVSRRVGGYRFDPSYSNAALDQLWIR
jgi:ABC-type transport system substrate-binding protein